MQTCTQRGPHARDEKQKDKKTRLIKYKRKREQDKKNTNITTKKENTMSRTKDGEAENRRTREQIIKERIQENKGTRDRIIKPSVEALVSPQDVSSEKQESKITRETRGRGHIQKEGKINE